MAKGLIPSNCSMPVWLTTGIREFQVMTDSSLPSWLRKTSQGLSLSLAIQPGARKNQIVGEFDGCLKLKIAAPPVDGEANKAVLSWLAKLLGLKKSQLELASGATSRRKIIKIQGVTPDAVLSLLVPESP